jgi:hypothetical protein
MVLLHAMCAGVQPLRATDDIDVLADLLTGSDGLRLMVDAIKPLGFQPVEDSAGRVYRFARPQDNVVVDVLAPDHTPPRWQLRTIRGRDTIQVDGGRQAMQRPALIEVVRRGSTARIPFQTYSVLSCRKQPPGRSTVPTGNATAATPRCWSA